MSEQNFKGMEQEFHANFCPSCGSELISGTKFCVLCGNKIEQNAQAPNRIEPMKKQETSQKKDVVYADFGERFVAFIIDSIFISLIISAITGLFGQGFYPWDFDIADGWRWLFSLPYFWISAINGQSIGYMIMKLRVVRDGSYTQLDGKQGLLHVVGKVFFLPIDIIICWFADDSDSKRKEQFRVTQRLAKSVVIKQKLNSS